jgi:hypothetical protein
MLPVSVLPFHRLPTGILYTCKSHSTRSATSNGSIGRKSARNFHHSSKSLIANSSKREAGKVSNKADEYAKASWIKHLNYQRDANSRELTKEEKEAFLARRERRLQESSMYSIFQNSFKSIYPCRMG